MLKRYLCGGLLAAFIGWCPPGLSAPSSSPSGPMPAVGKDNPVHVFADTVTYEAPHKLMHLDGHVHFDMKDTALTTEHAEFNTETQLGKLTGGVKIAQPGSTVTADHMLIFYAKRRAMLAGGVHLLTTETKPGQAAVASGTPSPPTTLDSDELNYLWEQQLGDAVGHVKVVQGDKKATSDVAHYNGVTGLVTLEGHVQFYDAGNWMQARTAHLNTKDQTFTAENVIATLYPNQDKKPTASPSPAAHPGLPPTRVMVPPLAPQLQPVIPLATPSDLPASP